MRIAFLCGDTGIAVFGDKGASVHVRELATAFTRDGHDVEVVAARVGRQAAVPWRAREVPSTAGGCLVATARGAEWRACRANAATRAVLDHLHARWPIDLVYERYSLWQHAGVSFARRARVPHVLEVNSPLRLEQARYRTLHLAQRARRVEGYVLRGASRIVAVSTEVAEYVTRRGAEAARVRVVPNGTDLEPFRSLQRTGIPGRFTVGFLGSLKPWHGVDTLIDAAGRLAHEMPELHLLIVGDGPERAALEAQATTIGLAGRASFVGAVPKRDVPSWLAQMDVAVAPYPPLDDFYFSPLKLYDYMAAGCAVVASGIGQIAGVLTHGVNGLLVPPGDVGELAACLKTLQERPAMAAALGAQARAAAFANHGWERRVADILDGITGHVVTGSGKEMAPCPAC